MKLPITNDYADRTYISNDITADTTSYYNDFGDYWHEEDYSMVDFRNAYFNKAINRVALIENTAKVLEVVINFNKDKVYFRCAVTSRNRSNVLTRIKMI